MLKYLRKNKLIFYLKWSVTPTNYMQCSVIYEEEGISMEYIGMLLELFSIQN
jgi:hypothetical protein